MGTFIYGDGPRPFFGRDGSGYAVMEVVCFFYCRDVAFSVGRVDHFRGPVKSNAVGAVADGQLSDDLAIGSVVLADGTLVKGFIAEPRAIEGARDITTFGGWRAYIASLS